VHAVGVVGRREQQLEIPHRNAEETSAAVRVDLDARVAGREGEHPQNGTVRDVRALVQRVTEASVTVDGERTGAIGRGLCVLVGATHDDGEAEARKLAEKVWHLRVFPDEAGAMNRSVAEAGGALLVVSQFTLYGDTTRGRRPSWIDAARPEHAEPLIDALVAHLRSLGAEVATGRFRTDMQVALVNDGPVTLLLEV
jgi:D-tyrosyl-tRNA(Tyr) deacylase